MPNYDKNRRRILTALADGDLTRIQLRELLGIGEATISRWITRLLDEDVIHVHRSYMNEARNKIVDVFRLGSKPPGFKPERPKVLGDLGRSREYRKKMRASGDWADTLARRRADYWRKKAGTAPPKDPLFSLFK